MYGIPDGSAGVGSGQEVNMAKKPLTDGAFQNLKAAVRNKAVDRLYFFYGEESFLMKLQVLLSLRDVKMPLLRNLKMKEIT